MAHEPVDFPAGKAANTLRGACGAYVQTFQHEHEPRANCLPDSPRPFVFRASHLDGKRVSAGEEFHFDLNVFQLSAAALTRVVRAFASLKSLGARRGRVELREVWQLDQQHTPIVKFSEQQPPPAVALNLHPTTEASRLRIRFLTPTELKSSNVVALQPEFGILAARVRDRLSLLAELYGSGPLAIDFRGFGERARGVYMTRCELRSVEVERRSSRTGQRHPIGGFIGEAEYAGDLTEFVPYLRAAQWTGVGRQTVWGKGQIAVTLL